MNFIRKHAIDFVGVAGFIIFITGCAIMDKVLAMLLGGASLVIYSILASYNQTSRRKR